MSRLRLSQVVSGAIDKTYEDIQDSDQYFSRVTIISLTRSVTRGNAKTWQDHAYQPCQTVPVTCRDTIRLFTPNLKEQHSLPPYVVQLTRANRWPVTPSRAAAYNLSVEMAKIVTVWLVSCYFPRFVSDMIVTGRKLGIRWSGRIVTRCQCQSNDSEYW